MPDETHSHDALSGARDWLRQRAAHMAQLTKELETARARVAEIEAMLAEMGAPPAAAQPLAASQPRAPRAPKKAIDPKKSTIPEMVASVVADAAEGLSIGDIVHRVREHKPTAVPQVVYPAVYRMKENGRLRKEGDRYIINTTDRAVE